MATPVILFAVCRLDLEFQLAFGRVASLVTASRTDIGLVSARNFITFIGVWSCGDPSKTYLPRVG